MAIAGDLRVFAALHPFPKSPSRLAFVSSASSSPSWFSSKVFLHLLVDLTNFLKNLFSLSQLLFFIITILLGANQKLYVKRAMQQMQFSAYSVRASNNFETKNRSQHISSSDHNRPQRQYHCFGIKSDAPSAAMNQDADVFLLNAVRMSFLERLALAWKILFPATTVTRNSNAKVAKQRLKMILFADRCAVSDEAKQKIVSNIIKALSDFVEIESQDKVQLSVSTDMDLGALYSVTVPVRRVKPGYQQSDEEYSGITGIEFRDKGEKSGCVDVKFDFYVPNERKRQIP